MGGDAFALRRGALCRRSHQSRHPAREFRLAQRALGLEEVGHFGERLVDVSVAPEREKIAAQIRVADAEASRILANAYGQDPEFFDLYRSLQVYRAGLTVGSPTLLLSPSSELMKFFDGGPFAKRPTEAAPPPQAPEK